jgi:hypothetical protein
LVTSMPVGPLERAAPFVGPRGEVQAHSVDVQFLMVKLHAGLVYEYVYRFAVNVYASSANVTVNCALPQSDYRERRGTASAAPTGCVQLCVVLTQGGSW